MSKPNVLPDSRLSDNRNSIRSPIGNLIPVYCANCGAEWGMVPEEHITFAFALCQPCADKHGPIAHTYSEPDAVFWERVKNAQQESNIHTPQDLRIALDNPSHPLAKLAKELKYGR